MASGALVGNEQLNEAISRRPLSVPGFLTFEEKKRRRRVAFSETAADKRHRSDEDGAIRASPSACLQPGVASARLAARSGKGVRVGTWRGHVKPGVSLIGVPDQRLRRAMADY